MLTKFTIYKFTLFGDEQTTLKDIKAPSLGPGAAAASERAAIFLPPINDIFKGFYTNLFKAETDFHEPICKQYLDNLELHRISQMDKESLEAPLSLEELHVSLKSLQTGKSPGLDGLPPELYLEIRDLVGTLILNSFNFSIEHGVFHRDHKI